MTKAVVLKLKMKIHSLGGGWGKLGPLGGGGLSFPCTPSSNETLVLHNQVRNDTHILNSGKGLYYYGILHI